MLATGNTQRTIDQEGVERRNGDGKSAKNQGGGRQETERQAPRQGLYVVKLVSVYSESPMM